jgi:hypothetical protein
MIVRLPMGGFILPQPALGFGGRPASPRTTASLIALASVGAEASGALESIEADPEPPIRLPELPVPLPDPPLPDLSCPEPPDVVCPLVELPDPPAPPDDPVVLAAPLAPPCVAGDDESEHAAPIARVAARRIEPRMLRMSGS